MGTDAQAATASVPTTAQRSAGQPRRAQRGAVGRPRVALERIGRELDLDDERHHQPLVGEELDDEVSAQLRRQGLGQGDVRGAERRIGGQGRTESVLDEPEQEVRVLPEQIDEELMAQRGHGAS